MRTAKIMRGITEQYEITAYCNGMIIAVIRCNDYEVDNGMIVCKHVACNTNNTYNSYVFLDKYTCETWRG